MSFLLPAAHENLAHEVAELVSGSFSRTVARISNAAVSKAGSATTFFDGPTENGIYVGIDTGL